MINRYNAEDCKLELELYKTNIELPSVPKISEVEDILIQITQGNFSSVGPIELLEKRTMLSAYSLFILQEENRLKSYIHWCESNIEVLVGKELGNCQEYGYNAKIAFIKAHNENINTLDTNRMLAALKLQTIQNLSLKIHNLAESLKDLAYMRDRRAREI